VIAHLADAAKMDAILSNTLGTESGKGMSQYYQALRAGEIMNLGPHPERLKAFTEGVMKAVIASGGRMDAEQIRQFASTSGAAGLALDPDFVLRYLPELIMEQGGSKVGTMTATFMRSGVGRTTHAAAEEWERLGLLDPNKVSSSGHGATAGMHFAAGAWQDEFNRFNNPGKYLTETVAPKLKDEQGPIDYRKAAAGDQHEMVRLIRELNVLFTDRNAAKFAEQLLLQAPAMEKFHNLTDLVNADLATMLRLDPTAAWKAFTTATEGVRAAIVSDQLMGSLPGLNYATYGLTHLAEYIADHPARAAVVAGVGGAGAVGAMGYAAWGLVTAGPALKGSAVALTEAAAALTRSAAVQAGEGGAGGAAKRAIGPGAAGGIGLAGWLGIGTGLLGVAAAYDFLWGKSFEHANNPDFQSRFTDPSMPFGDGYEAAREQLKNGYLGLPDSGLASGLPPYGTSYPPWTGATAIPGNGPDLFADPLGGAPGGSGLSGVGDAIVDKLNSVIQSLEVALSGAVTLTGDVHLNIPGFGEAIGRLIAQGLAHATGGAGAAPTTGARPDFSGGVSLPGPF
jgi:hypothetical protein